MRRKSHKNSKKASAGKVVTGILIGGVVGATVGWLTAPASGEETRRRLKGEMKGYREKAKTASGNVESRARELVEEVNDNVEHVRRRSTSPTQRRKIPASG